MKRLNIINILLVAAGLLAGCERELDTLGISRVTYFPTFEMNGDQFLSLVEGDSYTEAGVTATESGTEIPVTTTGTVNTAVPGVYTITYSATNQDGFDASITRTIAVLPEPEQEGVNIAGAYSNVGSFNYTATVVKLAPGFYRSSNIWGGGSAAIIPAYLITTDGSNITIPLASISAYGPVQGTGTLSPDGALTLSVSLLDYGVTNSTRKWQKQ